MKYISGIFLMLLLPAFLNAQDATGPGKVIFQADSLFQAGDYEMAATYYEKAAAVYKALDKTKYIFFENKVADCYAREGRLDEATALAERILNECTSEDQKAELWNTIGLINLNKGKY